MVAYNVTLDDTSPMIEYSGNWSTLHTDDSKANLYFMKTFGATTAAGGSATLRFNGSAIWAYGAKRFNHGKYTAVLDGKSNTYSGYSPEPGEIQAVLFQQTGLETDVEHSLMLTNAEEHWWFDVDYYVIQHDDIDQTHELAVQTVTVDTPSPQFFTYKGNWKDYTGGEYSNSTGAVSFSEGDSVAFTFTGTSVAVYGGVYWNHGMYTAILDGVGANYNGSYGGDLTGQTNIFHRAGLQNVSHTVTLINHGVTPTDHFGIDYVQYNYTIAGTPLPCATCSSSSIVTRTTSSSSIPTTLVMASTSLSSTIYSSATNIPGPATFTTEFSVWKTSLISTAGVGGARESSATRSHHGLSHGALAGIIIGCIAVAACIGFLIWRCTRRLKKTNSLYYWDDRRPLTIASSDGYNSSPMALTSTPVGPYQDSPKSGRQVAAWPSAAATLPVTRQVGLVPGDIFLHHSPPPGLYDYYPNAESVIPPTEEGSPVRRAGNGLGSGDSRRGGTGGGLSAYRPNYTAPSSAALPSLLGDPADRTASQGYPSRPNVQLDPDPNRASTINRNVSLNSNTPSSIATTGSYGRRRKQMGLPLPPTSSPPTSVLSEDTLRQMRMVIEGRPQDFGPLSIPEDSRSEARTTLPPAYAQAMEPLPTVPVYPRRQGQI